VYRLKNLFFCVAAANPLDIATGAEGKNISVKGNDGNSFAEMMNLAGLYQMLKRDALIWSAIIILGCLISMFFIKRSDIVSERKKDIGHKILIVFLICSLITLLSIVVNVFDVLF